MARRKKEMDQFTRIHISQDKNECFFGVGDVVRGTFKNGETFEGEIIRIDIKKQDGKLYPIMDYKYMIPGEGLHQGAMWVDNIDSLEVVRFKGEEI